MVQPVADIEMLIGFEVSGRNVEEVVDEHSEELTSEKL